jgi:hypothetical protein
MTGVNGTDLDRFSPVCVLFHSRIAFGRQSVRGSAATLIPDYALEVVGD